MKRLITLKWLRKGQNIYICNHEGSMKLISTGSADMKNCFQRDELDLKTKADVDKIDEEWFNQRKKCWNYNNVKKKS